MRTINYALTDDQWASLLYAQRIAEDAGLDARNKTRRGLANDARLVLNALVESAVEERQP